MRLRHVACSILALGACVVHDTTGVNPGYGYGAPAPGVQAEATVGTVASAPLPIAAATASAIWFFLQKPTFIALLPRVEMFSSLAYTPQVALVSFLSVFDSDVRF